jgi:hypothetical protein
VAGADLELRKGLSQEAVSKEVIDRSAEKSRNPLLRELGCLEEMTVASATRFFLGTVPQAEAWSYYQTSLRGTYTTLPIPATAGMIIPKIDVKRPQSIASGFSQGLCQ